MTFKETMAALFSTAEGTYYKWKREERPIILLLEKYFTKEDLEEFLETGKIRKFENTDIVVNFINSRKSLYFDFFKKHNQGSIVNIATPGIKLYFKFLYFLKKYIQDNWLSQKHFKAAFIAFCLQHEYKFDNFGIAHELVPILNIIDFLDSEDGMWIYFETILEGNLFDFIKDTDLADYMHNGKIIGLDEALEINKNFAHTHKDPLKNEEVAHYYLYQCFNNIAPYSEKEIEPEAGNAI